MYSELPELLSVVDKANGCEDVELLDKSNLYVIPGLNDIVACDSPSMRNLPPATVTAYSTITVLFSKFIVLPVRVSLDVAVM